MYVPKTPHTPQATGVEKWKWKCKAKTAFNFTEHVLSDGGGRFDKIRMPNMSDRGERKMGK